jgi:hypothetical protein
MTATSSPAVYNSFQHDLWYNNQAIDAFAAEVSELLPSFLSTHHYNTPANSLPTASAKAIDAPPLPAGDGFVLAGVWMEGTGTAAARVSTQKIDEPALVCLHVIVVNSGNRPTLFELRLNNLPAAAMQIVGVNGTVAFERIFDGQCVGGVPFHANADNSCSATTPTAAYSINGTSVAAGEVTLVDFIDNQNTNIYRIGCAMQHPSAAAMALNTASDVRSSGGIVVDGGFEDVAVSMPTLYRSAWHIWMENMTDDRARLRVSTAEPYHGRYAAVVQLPTSDTIALGVPIEKTAAAGSYRVSLYARSSPEGLLVTPSMCEQNDHTNCDHDLQHTPQALSTEWALVTGIVTIGGATARSEWRPVLLLTSPYPLGGTIYIDSVCVLPVSQFEGVDPPVQESA